ncbi:hypothetical protein V8C35DRAFT_314345 [Trichoderma chlorosporum]
MKANPQRFYCPTAVEKECTWGFHHEGWARAYATIVFTKGRRSKTTDLPEAGPMQYVGVRGKTEKSETYAEASCLPRRKR